ncbi:hypothetical protein TNCV_3393571 [Trichonephila clavipes]|nr:hypothetical protein TNCV_3393571 [Trichonephila clavipes]
MICQLATSDDRRPCAGLGLPSYTIITPAVKRLQSVELVCVIVTNTENRRFQMPIRHPIFCSKLSWKYATLAIIMSTLVIGIISLLFYFTSSTNVPDSLSYSKAEPVWLGGRNGSTVIFPFSKDLWMNSSMIGPCPKNYFACNTSRKCLILDKRCDGNVDCPMAEDELNCVCAFRLPAAKFCDKYPDCFDESDESFCSYCPEKSFNCGDGKCIPKNKVCDTVVDCDNAMDENFCFRNSWGLILPWDGINSLSHARNWGGMETKRTVTCIALKTVANDRRKLAPYHDEFSGLRSDTDGRVALETTAMNSSKKDRREELVGI